MNKVTIAKVLFDGREARVFLSSGDELVMITDASVLASTDSISQYHIAGYIKDEVDYAKQPH